MREELETSPDYREIPEADALASLQARAREPWPPIMPLCRLTARGEGGARAARSRCACQARVAHYQKHYETVSDDALGYVKIINAGERLKINNVKGFLPVRTRRRPRGPRRPPRRRAAHQPTLLGGGGARRGERRRCRRA